MIEALVLSGIAFAVGVCLLDVRRGFYLAILVGFLQDPLRKLVPGEPVYFTVLAGVLVGAAYVGVRLRGVRLNFRAIHMRNPLLRTPLTLFIIVVVVQAAAAFARTGSPVIAAIGLLAYLAPLSTLLLGYYLTRSERDIERYMKFYVIVCILMSTGVYLSVLGYEWDILRAVGAGLYAYAVGIGRIDLHNGFFRGSELAGWHGATGVCMLILMYVSGRRRVIAPWITGLFVLFLVVAILFTGRRKFLVEVVLFISFYAVVLAYFGRGSRRLGLLMAASIVGGIAGLFYFSSSEILVEMIPYYQRSLALQDQATDRFMGMTVDAFQFIVSRNGWLGAGAGMGSQGAQYFGGGSSQIGSAAEGGLGKVLAELGVPGVLALGWLVVNVIRYVWALLKFSATKDAVHTRLVAGMASFLGANAMVFLIAHQIFGDVFVLLILGWILGVILAVPRFYEQSSLPSRPVHASPPAAQGAQRLGPAVR